VDEKVRVALVNKSRLLLIAVTKQSFEVEMESIL